MISSVSLSLSLSLSLCFSVRLRGCARFVQRWTRAWKKRMQRSGESRHAERRRRWIRSFNDVWYGRDVPGRNLHYSFTRRPDELAVVKSSVDIDREDDTLINRGPFAVRSALGDRCNFFFFFFSFFSLFFFIQNVRLHLLREQDRLKIDFSLPLENVFVESTREKFIYLQIYFTFDRENRNWREKWI